MPLEPSRLPMRGTAISVIRAAKPRFPGAGPRRARKRRSRRLEREPTCEGHPLRPLAVPRHLSSELIAVVPARGAPRDARVAGTPLRGPIFQSRWLWVPACAGTTVVATYLLIIWIRDNPSRITPPRAARRSCSELGG